MTVQPILNQSAAEAFAENLLAAATGAASTMMVSLGHRTGLFDTMSALPPSTSEEIAEVAGLNERYVREWLGAMVTAGVVRLEDGRFRLPNEHAASLTRAAGADNFATMAQMLTSFATVEDELVECFRNGGGVPYSSFKRFNEVMSDTSDATIEKTIDDILALSPSTLERLRAGIDVLDLGCGRGHASILMAQRFPRSRFYGYDFSEDAIAFARQRAADEKLANVEFEVRDAALLDEENRYGLVVTFDAIHDQARPDTVLANIHRALRPSGLFLMVEPFAASELEANVEHPLGTILYTISTFHCMTVSLALDGDGLGTMWGRELAEQKLLQTGFRSIRMARLPGDLINAFFFARKA